MTYKIYIPIDSTSLSLGANEVYEEIKREALKREVDLTIIRNGSRGLFWLEPLVEVETTNGRVAFGPVTVGDVKNLFDQEFYIGKDGDLCLGLTDELHWLKNQERLTFSRVGIKKNEMLSM